MNAFSVGRALDQWVGAAVCFFLMLIRVIGVATGLMPFVPSPGRIEKIVFIKIVGFGSIVLATPAIRAVRHKYPDAKLAIVTLAANREVVELTGLFDEVIAIKVGGLLPTIQSCFRTLFRVREIRPDVIVDLEIFSNLSSIFVFLSGPAFSIGFGSFKLYRDVFYNDKVSFDHSRHIVDIYLKMVSLLDAEPQQDELTCFDQLPRDGLREIAGNIAGLDFHRPVVFVNINTGELALQRRMPTVKFVRIMEMVVEKVADVQFALIGAPADVPAVKEFRSILPRSMEPSIVDLAGKTTIRELLAIFSQGTAYLGNDSGPLHLAAAMRLPCVAFFGPETPRLYGHNALPNRMFYTNRFCSPCMNSYHYKLSRCSHSVCLEQISEQEVAAAMIEIIKSRANGPDNTCGVASA